MIAFHSRACPGRRDRGAEMRLGLHPVSARLLALVGAAVGAAAAVGCGNSAARAPEKKAPEVVVTTPITDDVTDYEDFTGRLDAIKTIDIRARVSGYILSAPFKEGDLVREGDLLFLIDPQPYAADFNLAKANVRLAESDQNLQGKNAIRARKMVKTDAMSQEDFETTLATWEKSQATVAAMGASRDRAKLYLDYCRVVAPLSGRISRRAVDPGNLVNADTTTLTTLVADSQLYAYFDVDERTYLNLVGRDTPSASALSEKLRFPVLLSLANENYQFNRSGVVDFVDNRVNANTGTIRMRAVFDNPAGALRSGLFVRIRVPVGAPYRAILIPDEAVLSDQGRKNVYVIGDNNEVVYRSVTLGQEIKGLRVVKDGVSEGERVVISGMQRVRPGVRVNANLHEPPKPPGSPLGKLLSAAHADHAAAAPPGSNGLHSQAKETAGAAVSDKQQPANTVAPRR